MEKYINKQLSLYQRISNTVTNMKKLGTAKITDGVVNARLELLEKNWNNFTEGHDQLLDIVTPEYATWPYFASDHLALCEEAYLTNKAALLDLRKPVEQLTTAQIATPPHRSLPRIDVPRFAGDYRGWASYRDLFTSLVIENKQLSGVERFQHLKISLSGEPAQLIQNIRLTEANFTGAWKMITARYENLRILIQSHLSALSSLPTMRKESASCLKPLLNGTLDVVQSLGALGRPVEHWDDWLVFGLVQKLDVKTRLAWESSIGTTTDPPSFDQLHLFLTGHLRALEAVEEAVSATGVSPSSGSSLKNDTRSARFKTHTASVIDERRAKCPLCSNQHFVLFCARFKGMSPHERKKLAADKNLCFNCLGSHHSSSCKSTKRCQLCVGKHHTMLHVKSEQESSRQGSPQRYVEESRTSHCARASWSNTQSSSVIFLATAKILVRSSRGEKTAVRALIDPCSEVSLVSERLAQAMKLERSSARIPILGVGSTGAYTRGSVTLTFSSTREQTKSLSTTAYVLPRLSSYSPTRTTAAQLSLSHLRDLELADPNFHSAERVDIILGADVYSEIILEGLRKGPPNSPVAQCTSLGSILTGHCNSNSYSNPSRREAATLQCVTRDADLSESLQRFWELEEVANPPRTFTSAESECEQHFCSTHSRDSTGRYQVRLPFNASPARLGNSLDTARVLLNKLETRLKGKPALESLYNSFLEEYLPLGHMEPVPEDSISSRSAYYLPHHGVVRDASTTTRLRVVFNASQKTKSGLSLNNLLHTGPNLLPEIFHILLRWRKHAIVFSADVQKMYRQIQVAPEDCDFQRILWRQHPREAPRHFRLLTVTYGTSCAPFLAVRTLRQLCKDERHAFPLAAACASTDVYVDDVISGADSISNALALQRELLQLFKAGGFSLHKWTSNRRELLEALPSDARKDNPDVHCNLDNVSTLLGLLWHSSQDAFHFFFEPRTKESLVTKRIVFREVASLFDPLGFLAPVIVTAKIFMQSLWLLKLSWDEPLPLPQAHFWQNYYEQLRSLSSVRIPRWLLNRTDNDRFELHGFADASERAYAAVIYLRSSHTSGMPFISLVSSKTRVAPLKQISVPRLELCAASLLTRLTLGVRSSLSLENCSINLWSDSTVVLSWLQGHSSRWKTFVANRVADIQTSLPAATWRHIKSNLNPADVASRGVAGHALLDHSLWWKGPPFLSLRSYDYDQHSIYNFTTDQEVRATKMTCLTTTTNCSFFEELAGKFSTLTRLLRTVGWCLRFCRTTRDRSTSSQVSHRLSVNEINNALLACLRCFQRATFTTEMDLLQDGGHITRGPTARLAPFIDDHGVLRVGGRLKHSLLDEWQKHPAILPAKAHFTTLVIRDAHLRLLHGGTQLTLATLRRKYWILAGRRAVRRVIASCVVCSRWRAQAAHQQMGNLPAPRAQPSRPFTNTGIDYAGPFLTKQANGRGQTARKSYIAVFVCLATRAVHLELVSDATTAAFLAAFRWFISRRGVCLTLYSDQGTNFVGACKELRKLFQTALLDWREVAFQLSQEGTSWRFNPPGAPHFGGIWEAAVKSLKFHLRRVAGGTPLTFEETATLLAQIEACLNSRPIAALTDDLDSIDALTPAHFLIGAPLKSLPEPSLSTVKISPLRRWHLIQQMRDHFWIRWSSEYLHQLQTRSKWRTTQPNVQIGDLCLIKNELTPPSQWPLGRITATFKGDDQHVRVVAVKTATTTLTRPITKICLLPPATEEN